MQQEITMHDRGGKNGFLFFYPDISAIPACAEGRQGLAVYMLLVLVRNRIT